MYFFDHIHPQRPLLTLLRSTPISLALHPLPPLPFYSSLCWPSMSVEHPPRGWSTGYHTLKEKTLSIPHTLPAAGGMPTVFYLSRWVQGPVRSDSCCSAAVSPTSGSSCLSACFHMVLSFGDGVRSELSRLWLSPPLSLNSLHFDQLWVICVSIVC